MLQLSQKNRSITIKKLLYFAVKVDQFDIPRFNALCRGEELRVSNKIQDNKKVNNADLSKQDPKYVAKLKCYQKTMNNPYYKLGPIKEEIIHINPSIWMYHDIASPLERQGIIQTAGPFVSSNIKEKVVTNRP